MDVLVASWRRKPWYVDYGQNPGLVFPVGVVDIPEDHAQRVHAIDAEMDNIMVVATAQRGKSTTLMSLITSAALMYRPERVTFFCIGASLYPVEELPHVASVVSQTDNEGVSRTVASIEGLILAREAAFKQYQIDISEFRERRFGTERGGGTDPADKFGDVFLVVDNFSDLYDKDSAMGDRWSRSPARACPTASTLRPRHGWLVGQKQALVNVSNARIQLRLSNPDETQMGEGLERRRAARNTLDRPGFGVTREGHELLVGVPEITSATGERVTTRQLGAVIAEVTGVGRVEKLARLPERIELAQIIAAFAATDVASDPFNVPVRHRRKRLAGNVFADPGGAQHVGAGPPGVRQDHDPGCLRTGGDEPVHSRAGADHHYRSQDIADRENPRTACAGVRLYRRRYRRRDRGIGGDDARPSSPLGSEPRGVAFPDTWDGPHQFLLIDDEQELRPHGAIGKAAASAPLWGLIERSREMGLHVIASRLPGNWAGISVTNPFLQKMTSSRAPTLFMDNDPATVKVFGRVGAQQLPPGRGLLVTTDGAIEGVLVGTPE